MRWLAYLRESRFLASMREAVFTAFTSLPLDNASITIDLPLGITTIPFSLQKGELFQLTCKLSTLQSYQLYGRLSSAGVASDLICEFHPNQNGRVYQAPQDVAALVVNQQNNVSRLTIWPISSLPMYIGKQVQGWLR